MSSRLKISIIAVVFLAVFAFAIEGGPTENFYQSSLNTAPDEPTEPVRLLIVGDIMFDRTIRAISESKGYEYPLSCIRKYADGFDALIGNLEGPITEHASFSLGTKPGEPGNTTFTFSPKVASALFDTHFRVLNLGNNHIYDLGRTGASSTVSFLENAGIRSFGIPGGIILTSLDVKGRRIAFINYNQFLGQNDPQRTKDAIWRAQRDNDFIIVYTHWGEEYVEATDYVKALAHSFIDAGADMVIGSHPHVIQAHELYAGKHIFYSLGNFIFDQYWNDEVSKGLGVEVTLAGKDVQVEERELKILRDGRTCLFGGTEIFE